MTRWNLASSAAALLLALSATGTSHAAGEVRNKAESVANAASGVAVKAENGVKRGASATTRTIRRGVGAANRGADKVAAKVGIKTTDRNGKRIVQPEARPGVRPTDPKSSNPPD